MIGAPDHPVVSAIYRAREARADDGFRPHLGASRIGHHCKRALWLEFRWAKRAAFDGRMLRLFDTGLREEARFIAELRMIGCEVSEGPAAGQQWRWSAFGGHFGGSMDCGARGFPDMPKEWHVVEFKTHSLKSFDQLEREGVQKAKPQHWCQMQIYMHLGNLNQALYLACCKNDDRLYSERVAYDKQAARDLMERAEFIIFAAEPPPTISADPAWYQCKFCDYHALCHGTEAPAPTCRSCAHATPDRAGHWSCAWHDGLEIPPEAQPHGCLQHRYIPILLERWAEPLNASESANTVEYRNKLTGQCFHNAIGGPTDYSSIEIHAAADKCAIGAEAVAEFKAEFAGCQVVG